MKKAFLGMLLVVIATGLGSCADTGAKPDALPITLRESVGVVALDPDQPVDKRKEAVAVLESIAEGEKQDDRLINRASALYILGSLYRLGKQHPAKFFEQDLEKAALYLSNASTFGMVAAMAAMAELKLTQHKPLDAMIWAQVFAYYTKVQRETELEAYGVDNGAYAAFLLSRCFDSLGKKADHDEIQRGAAAFAAQYDQQIREAIKKNVEWRAEINRSTPNAALSLLRQNAPTSNENWPKTPGAIVYILAVDLRGKVIKTFVADSLPDEAIAKAFRRVDYTSYLHFNEVPKEADVRWAQVPVYFDNNTFSIKK